MELPELGTRARVDRFEPAVHRAVEDDVAARRQYAAVHRELLLLHTPHFSRADRIPRYELALVPPGTAVHPDARAKVRRARDVVRLRPLVIHACVVRRD